MSIVNVSKSEVIELLAKELKKVIEIKPPVWAAFVKTGPQAERPPMNPDWWFVRTASMLTKISDLGPIGVSKLRIKYGGKRNRGMAPERFARSGGKHLRLILQQLEKAGFVKQTAKGLHKGRVITPKGVAFVDKVSYRLMKEQNIVLPKNVVAVAHHVVHSAPLEQSAEQKSAEPSTVEQKVEEPKKPKIHRKPRKKAEESQTHLGEKNE